MKFDDLLRLYRDAEQVDRAIFAEQRANVLLVSGDHYAQQGSERQSNSRDGKDSSQKQMRLRLVKNHCYKLNRRYVKAVMANAGGVRFTPQVESELAHQKAADLNNAVWQYIHETHKLSEKKRRWASDFCSLGEVFVKVFWDNDDGKLVGFYAETDGDGEDIKDENGDLIPNKKMPAFSGKIQFERYFGFNVLRDPAAKEIEESPYLILRKMVSVAELKKRYKADDEKVSKISESTDEEYIVFDTNTNSYARTKGKTTVLEYYFRPSVVYPEGYFYITTDSVILEEGTLPEGIFPIVAKCFDEHQTSARGRSFLKQAKPYQVEINRSASQQSLHAITLGDDKILYQAGSKLEPGALLPGVRGIAYNGSPPQILEGRDGMKQQGYIESQIREFYTLFDADDMFAPNSEIKGSNDLMALLFRNAAQRQNLSEYSEKFEEFLIDICKTAIEIARVYLPDDEVIPAVGKHEMINIDEFRNSDPLLSRVSIRAQDDTLDTQFGKQIIFQNLLQYAGSQLSKQDIGMLMRSMPYANSEEQFREYTIDYDNARNIMLALERGEYIESIPEDNHEYIVNKLSSRMKQADFRYLPQQIQELYRNKREEHQRFAEELRQKALAEQSEFIPSDGALIACDLYVEDSADPNKAPKRARIPQKALDWLLSKLEAQKGPIQTIQGSDLGQMQTAEGIRESMLQQQMQQQQAMPPQASGGLNNPGFSLPPLMQ